MLTVILAAGVGSRLAAPGQPSKPARLIEGEPMISRLGKLWLNVGVQEFIVVLRTGDYAARSALLSRIPREQVLIVEGQTSCAMDSLLLAMPHISAKRFFLSMVDSVFVPEQLEKFAAESLARTKPCVLVAASDFVMDEKPVYVRLDRLGRVIELGRDVVPTGLVSAGMYACSVDFFNWRASAFTAGVRHLSDYLQYVLRAGCTMRGVNLGKVVDVDSPADLAEAEKYLASTG